MVRSRQSQESVFAPWQADRHSASVDARPRGAATGGTIDHPLVQVIRSEVIPRLLVAHRTSSENLESPWHKGGELAAEAVPTPVPDDIAYFAHLLLARDISESIDYVDGLVAQGMNLESVYIHLLAPTARLLREKWDSDDTDFVSVTVAMMQLQSVLRELGRAFDGEIPGPAGKRRVLLSGTPGDRPLFGVARISESMRLAGWFEFLRRAGWHVVSGPTAESARELEQWVRDDWFAVVGLSVSRGVDVDCLITAVRKIRRASLNQAVRIMVGGPIFDTNDQLAELVGADAVCSDGPGAVTEAESLLGNLP